MKRFERKGAKGHANLVSHFHPQNHVGRGWGIRNGAMGAVRLPEILVVTVRAFFIYRWIDTQNAEHYEREINQGDVIVIKPGHPYQLQAL